MQHHERGVKMRERIIAAQVLELERRRAVELAAAAYELHEAGGSTRTDGAAPRGRR